MKIALDAMGGDFLAVPNLQGAFTAVEKSRSEGKDLKVYLCGPRDRLMATLPEAANDPSVPSEFKIDIPRFEKRHSAVLKTGKLHLCN